MATLNRAIEIAVAAHRGQTDKAGRPYILHPLWLMQQFEDEDAMIVSILHDVVEDSAFTLADLSSEGFAPDVVRAIDAISRRVDESYEEYVSRVRAHPVARRVKLADLEHNMDLRRMGRIDDRDLERLGKYHETWRKMKDTADQ